MSISRDEFAAMGLDFTADQMAGIGAGASQIYEAMREAETFDSAAKYPVLESIPDVRNIKQRVMELHRSREWPEGLRMQDSRDTYEWKAGQGGLWLPEFDRDNPDHAGKMFGVFAYRPGDLHVLSDAYSVDRWLGREPIYQSRCDWSRYTSRYTHRETQSILRRCQSKSADEYLVLSQGQYLIAVATCGPCRDWLLAGGSLDQP